MNPVILTSTSSNALDDDSNGGRALGSLKQIFTNPILYIVIGVIILLCLIIYFIRRFIKARPNAKTIIIRRGKIYKVLDRNNPKCFLVPFIDSIGAIITDEEKIINSDKLYINNGPDALYKINYTLKYKVINPEEFYRFIDNLQNILPVKLNDELRLYADQGNALILIKDYRNNANKILEVINRAVAEYYIEVIDFKINIIEPMGK